MLKICLAAAGLAATVHHPRRMFWPAWAARNSRLPPDFMIPEPGRILPGEEEDLFSDEEAADFHVDFLDVEEGED